VVPAWRHGNRSGKAVMSHADDGGQAPDQASSGRQAGAAVQAGRVIAKTRRNGQHPDESRPTRQHQPWRAAQTDRPWRVSQHPERAINESRVALPVSADQDQGYSSCWGRSSEISCHEAFEPTNMCAVALSAGSSINEPYGTRILPS
jgi:hypothetical protein